MHSAGFLLIGFGGQNILRLAPNLILTRLLFPETFGLMDLVQVFPTGPQIFVGASQFGAIFAQGSGAVYPLRPVVVPRHYLLGMRRRSTPGRHGFSRLIWRPSSTGRRIDDESPRPEQTLCSPAMWHAERHHHLAWRRRMTDTSQVQIRSTPAVSGIQRYYLIDGLRTICALIVVLYHYRNMFTNPAAVHAGIGFDAHRDMLFFRYIPWVIDQGALAVMMFWTISGFIFAHMYSARRTISGYKFFVRRFSRLYPLHFVTLFYVALLQIAAVQALGTQIGHGNNSLWNFVLNLFFVSGWNHNDMFSFNVPAWSVSVEVAIYIAFFVLLKYVGVTLLTTLCAAVASAVLMLLSKNLIPVCGFYFFLGSAAWVVMHRLEAMAPRARGMLLAGVVCAAVLPLLVQFSGRSLPLSLVLAPLCAGTLALLAMIEQRLPREPAALEAIGDITYSTYLLHIPMQMTFIFAMMAGLIPPRILLHPAAPAVYLLVVILAGHYCFRHFERPAQDFLRKRL